MHFAMISQTPRRARDVTYLNRITARMRLPGEGEDGVEALSFVTLGAVRKTVKLSFSLDPCFFFILLRTCLETLSYVEFEYCYYTVIFLMSRSIIDGVI
jgi:hypothetical protein